MKKIPLTQGLFALIDDDDHERVCQYNWCAWDNKRGHIYAVARVFLENEEKKRMTYLHRFILNAKKGEMVDHKNRDGLDCQKENLRRANRKQNATNTKQLKNESGYRGVRYMKNRPNKPWRADIRGKESRFIGCYKTKQEAALAYNEEAIRIHGDFATLNVIRED